VDGLSSVSLVTVYPDRVLLDTESEIRIVSFASIGQLQEPRLSALRKRCTLRRPYARMVADRNWFNNPAKRFFTFYTKPRITIFMPSDDVADYITCYFSRVHDVIHSDRFATFDLG
jgi:hypothetical protein